MTLWPTLNLSDLLSTIVPAHSWQWLPGLIGYSSSGKTGPNACLTSLPQTDHLSSFIKHWPKLTSGTSASSISNFFGLVILA